mmetsp:Transcript_16448/g.40684  ORF Transcript_16448/g.40684 Transcript_16448/m.40684 type:complete len:214 (+) Transcript_16448:479-1120(+)
MRLGFQNAPSLLPLVQLQYQNSQPHTFPLWCTSFPCRPPLSLQLLAAKPSAFTHTRGRKSVHTNDFCNAAASLAASTTPAANAAPTVCAIPPEPASCGFLLPAMKTYGRTHLQLKPTRSSRLLACFLRGNSSTALSLPHSEVKVASPYSSCASSSSSGSFKTFLPIFASEPASFRAAWLGARNMYKLIFNFKQVSGVVAVVLVVLVVLAPPGC